MIGPDGEGGGVRYACERSSHSWLPLSGNRLDGEGVSVGRLFVLESDGGANRERLNAAGSEIERGRLLGFCWPERDRERDDCGTYDGFEVRGGRCGCCSCIPALMGVEGADEIDNFESGRRRIEDGSNFPSSLCVIAMSPTGFAPILPNSPPTAVWYDGGGVRGRNMGSAGEVDGVDGEYILVVRVRKRTGKDNVSSSVVPSRASAVVVPFASDSTFHSVDVASTVEVKVCEWSSLVIDDEHTDSLSQSSSPSSSHTGNNHVGLSGIVLVGLSGNDTNDIPGPMRFSNTKLSGTRFKFSTPYFPCRSSRSCAVKAYRDSGELRNGLPRERPVGTIGPRGIRRGKQRPGGQMGGEFVSGLF